jgi:hypothetical protein
MGYKGLWRPSAPQLRTDAVELAILRPSFESRLYFCRTERSGGVQIDAAFEGDYLVPRTARNNGWKQFIPKAISNASHFGMPN